MNRTISQLYPLHYGHGQNSEPIDRIHVIFQSLHRLRKIKRKMMLTGVFLYSSFFLSCRVVGAAAMTSP